MATGAKSYGFISIVLVVLAMVPFLMLYEMKKPKAREWIPLAVMAAIAAVGRAAFAFVPHFKPTSAIIVITAMVFGPEAGFLVGAISGFVSNFMFGQGPWTPWQMYAWGLVGYLAGVLADVKALERPWAVYAFGLASGLLYGGILNGWHVLGFVRPLTWQTAAAAFAAGLPLDVTHGVATAVFLLLIWAPWRRSIARVVRKYDLGSGD
jgi:energy-coupling factor transport system substrate-specific component